uniref:ORF14a n=1 Tax=Avian adenovirus 8 (strain ATCC A-2A) TaxID=66295 RepID=Q30BN6_ADEG8|nr:ORF14a [Fowl aviadenovirus 8]
MQNRSPPSVDLDYRFHRDFLGDTCQHTYTVNFSSPYHYVSALLFFDRRFLAFIARQGALSLPLRALLRPLLLPPPIKAPPIPIRGPGARQGVPQKRLPSRVDRLLRLRVRRAHVALLSGPRRLHHSPLASQNLR